jgi:hypothetical protein
MSNYRTAGWHSSYGTGNCSTSYLQEGSFHRRLSNGSSQGSDVPRDVEMGEVEEGESDGRPDFRHLPTLKVTKRGTTHTGSTRDFLTMPTYDEDPFRANREGNANSPT